MTTLAVCKLRTVGLSTLFKRLGQYTQILWDEDIKKKNILVLDGNKNSDITS